MAWIESHEEIPHHPKTRKLARRLDISIPAAVGHLHCLWHWAVSFADDGDLSRYSNEDVAIGAMWDGDPDVFVQALCEIHWMDCSERARCLHDWEDYAGRLVERRKANAERMRAARATHKRPTPHSRDDTEQVTDPAHADHVMTTTGATVPNQTKPDLTKPESKPTPPASRDAICAFEAFWDHYPRRDGKKPEKAKAQAAWERLSKRRREQATVAVEHYRAACDAGLTRAKDAFRWLVSPDAIDDWQTPAQPALDRNGHDANADWSLAERGLA